MNDSMCEKCKYRDASALIPPCTVCKHAFLRGTKDFDEWREFCKWVEQLPYSELITGKETEENG